jgi:hypothetical protein
MKKSDPHKDQARVLKAAVRQSRLRYAACINQRNRWAHKAEQAAEAATAFQVALRRLYED